jgi:hypothetical protein
MSESRDWSVAEFGRVDLGDTRRTERLVAIGAAACERPCGRVAAVFLTDREREGAYDFFESDHVEAKEIMAGIAAATVTRSLGQPFVFVAVDGTSVTVVDHGHEHDFGCVGSDSNGARGAKVVDALAIAPDGVVIGWLGLTFWARSPKRKVPARSTHARQARPVEEKETRYWLQTVKAASDALDERNLRGWFQIDREGDGCDLLLALRDSGHFWTVRGNTDRSVEIEGGDVGRLRAQLAAGVVAGNYELEVTARPKRRARTARMVVRVAKVLLRLRDRRNNQITKLQVTTVWAREEGTTPPGEEPIDWLLHTNRDVENLEDAKLVIYGYAQRWRVEECHRTWKGGECDVESMQLRSFAALERWATVLAAIATRIERIKRLSRTQPATPATIEFTPIELRALKMLKFGEERPDYEPTIAEAISWLAEMGGYANKYSGKPPGATVLGRGLRHLRPAARLLAIQLEAAK